ncbi:Receptor-type tyrosine-protein phosphatase N2 [Oryzias melastigma]|uniref:Receptor-type tyrosine-protein phosphatase N2 n=1 Tax=Oryzias melastigma TaxID=30732 RepID=A0A834C911_ORYME|nr:Receptor-type tyrosine-protein phosphatase N2 [Oryzias melastigma]
MAAKPPAERPEPISSRINSVSSQFSDGGPAVSPSARGSISSWSEEPAHSNMDISTGHMILSYMEDHLKNKDRLEKEWEALCAYQAEPSARTVGLKDGNAKKNRSAAVVAYDHSRITLRVENSQGNSDYINASPIMDHDPRNPAYIATQGPLPSTVADFWQMVWENGCVVIVMLTPLVENGVKQCYHYWPDEGSNLYHIYEVNLVSEHIWCDDFLVRSFYLKNMQTNETRTVTQFHFLTWLNQNVPETSRTLLDFRRKVNKCYRGRSCPIIVHCRQVHARGSIPFSILFSFSRQQNKKLHIPTIYIYLCTHICAYVCVHANTYIQIIRKVQKRNKKRKRIYTYLYVCVCLFLGSKHTFQHHSLQVSIKVSLFVLFFCYSCWRFVSLFVCKTSSKDLTE